MKRVFGDSICFIALLNGRDYHRECARLVTRQLPGPIVTTRRVIVEVGNALSGPGARKCFALFMQGLATQSRVNVLTQSDVPYEQGAKLFAARLDKEWSLTDCISFRAMRSECLEEVLTDDRHFAQAGFKLMMEHRE